MQRAGIRILDLKCYNADMRLQSIKCLLLLLLLAFGCKQPAMVISDLFPKAIDGVLNLRMNQISSRNEIG